MRVLGITGGSGCGKTTLLRRAAALGGCCIDCDLVYHRLLEADGPLRAAIGARFPAVAGDAWDRKKLGKLVFEDPQALRDLNAITHPRVVEETARQLRAAEAAGRPLAAIDAIALLESGLADLCDVTVAVTAPREARIRRLMAREGIGADYARLRLDAQREDGWFAARCGRVLANDGTESEFVEACDKLLLEIIGR